MLLVSGRAGETVLTGTLYEPGDGVPAFRGAPDAAAPYTWLCDECYEVETGGTAQTVAGREIRIAFESPVPRGFENREQAIDGAHDHLRTQFARLGVADPTIEVREPSA